MIGGTMDFVDAEVDGVTIVRTPKEARKVKRILQKLDDDIPQALDTETDGIDPKKEGPVKNGTVICFTAYCGPDVDFGTGPNLWVDTLHDPATYWEFQDYFKDPTRKKVWHNYSFDSHEVRNTLPVCDGFMADTMHMARLHNPERLRFSLEALTEEFTSRRKKPMSEMFGKPKLKKDGTPGKKIITPPPIELQTNPDTFEDWIDYCTYDTQGLWELFLALEEALDDMPWKKGNSLLDFYYTWWQELGECLTYMEARGFTVDAGYVRDLEEFAVADRDKHEKRFKEWVVKYCPDAARMNVGSDPQKMTLLFGGAYNEKTEEFVPETRKFKVDNIEGWIDPEKIEIYNKKMRERDPKKPPLKPPKPLKQREIVLETLGLEHDKGELTDTGNPKVGGQVLDWLAGKDIDKPGEEIWGTAYAHFGGGKKGKRACRALYSLAEVGRIDTLLSNFILAIPRFAKKDRIHAQFNINTKTGRLSSRKPNSQNLPALDKDRYGIRDAWCVGKPNPFDGKDYPSYDGDEPMVMGVWDYSQLELRILAHMSKCDSMIAGFLAGFDSHSQTAYDMYENVRDAVDAGKCLIDWVEGGEPPLPLLKEMFAKERRYSKAINFGIAYGKTAHGFAKDFHCSKQEAQAIIDRWYRARPEVLAWQNRNYRKGEQTEYVRTLMGRYRPCPQINNRRTRGRGQRIIANTPIQGGAADVVNAAMVQLHRNQDLYDTGWRMLAQCHDEILFEGPQRTKHEAASIIVPIMENPLPKPLRVPLKVDGGFEQTWMLAK